MPISGLRLSRLNAGSSARLSREQCRATAAECRQTHKAVAGSLDRLVGVFLTHAKGLEGDQSIALKSAVTLVRPVSRVVDVMLATTGQLPPLPEVCFDLLKLLCRFIIVNDVFSDEHRCITEVSRLGKRKEVVVHLSCLDASSFLSRQYKLFRSKVLFSATLRPGIFYRDTLGLPDTTTQLQLQSPFDPARACHAVVNWVDTRYREREKSLQMLLTLIHQVSQHRLGNYLVFFPSYAYLNQTYDAFRKMYPDTEVWRQTSDQSKLEQSHQLEHLDVPGHRIGFAILGGVFGEGIDYIGNKLIGLVVVSTGLPGLGHETQLVADYYHQQGRDGYDAAFRYPGFTRVLQTVGRLIRSEPDSGVVVLVDDRFRQSFYRQFFPSTWQVNFPSDTCALSGYIASFWQGLPDEPVVISD